MSGSYKNRLRYENGKGAIKTYRRDLVIEFCNLIGLPEKYMMSFYSLSIKDLHEILPIIRESKIK